LFSSAHRRPSAASFPGSSHPVPHFKGRKDNLNSNHRHRGIQSPHLIVTMLKPFLTDDTPSHCICTCMGGSALPIAERPKKIEGLGEG